MGVCKGLVYYANEWVYRRAGVKGPRSIVWVGFGGRGLKIVTADRFLFCARARLRLGKEYLYKMREEYF